MKRDHHTPEYIRSCVSYDPFTGTLWWKRRVGVPENWNTKYAGTPAFTNIDSVGYFDGRLDGTRYRAHRIIWVVVKGEWPEHEIDHKDHNGLNNMWENLRAATSQVNGQNKSILSSNTSGATGVWYDKRNSKWAAEIKIDSTKVFLGRFTEYEDAVAARKNAETMYGFHPNHGMRA